jgi:O-antigen ligase
MVLFPSRASRKRGIPSIDGAPRAAREHGVLPVDPDGVRLRDVSAAWVLLAVVICTFLSGFLNLASIGRLYPATVLIDGLAAAMAIALGVNLLRKRRLSPPPLWISALLLLAFTYVALSFFGQESPYVKLLALRNHVLYAVVAVFAVTFIHRREQARGLLRVLMRLGVGAAAFGIAQFAFRSVLPDWLMVSRDTNLFGYFGTDLSRSTALLGNTIIFSAIMLMFFALFAFKLVYEFDWRTLAGAAVIYCALLASFSRMSIVGGLAVIAAAAVTGVGRTRSIRTLFHWLGGGLLALGGAGLAALATLPGALGTATGGVGLLPFMQNPYQEQSTAGHVNFIQQALHVFETHPLFGIGIGSQSQAAVHTPAAEKITDGAFWIALAEGGATLTVVFVASAVVLVWTLARIWRRGSNPRWLAAGLTVFSIFQLGVASFLNTAFFGKNTFILYWVLFGLTVVLGSNSAGRPSVLKGDPTPAAGADSRRRRP